MSWSGSQPALVGFNSGNGMSGFTLPTSHTSGVRKVTDTGNTGVAGKWLFRVDESDIQMLGKAKKTFFEVTCSHEEMCVLN